MTTENEHKPPYDDAVRMKEEEVERHFPEAMEWLQNHDIAQVKDGRRLLACEEKLELFGGVEQVKNNLYTNGRPTPGTIILQACRQGPMIGIEIINFSEMIGGGRGIDPATLYYAISKLKGEDEGEGKIEEEDGITMIQKLGEVGGDSRYRVAERIGYKTTNEGMRSLALDLSQPKTRQFLRGLIRPKPKTS